MMLLNPAYPLIYKTYVDKWPHLFGCMTSPRGYPSKFFQQTNGFWGADNDVFTGNFDPMIYLAWVLRIKEEQHLNKCLFMAAPDRVADYGVTLEMFKIWQPELKKLEFPVALVLQDGATTETIPWDKIDAVFIGGSTEWKLSQDVIRILQNAGEMGKWRHIGRVNSHNRISYFWDFAESFDGTSFAIEPDNRLEFVLPKMLELASQSKIWDTPLWGSPKPY